MGDEGLMQSLVEEDTKFAGAPEWGSATNVNLSSTANEVRAEQMEKHGGVNLHGRAFSNLRPPKS